MPNYVREAGKLHSVKMMYTQNIHYGEIIIFYFEKKVVYTLKPSFIAY